MIKLERTKCGECHYDYLRYEDSNKVSMGQEMVYLATRAIDEPWFCPNHRASQ